MEMVHGTKTMVALYFFGAITGSLGVSVFDSEVSIFALFPQTVCSLVIRRGMRNYASRAKAGGIRQFFR
jgi:hypothetical protein